MKFDGNFRHSGTLDVSNLRLCVDRQPESAWLEDTTRQEEVRVHRDTQSIFLIYDKDFRHTRPTVLSKYAEFAPALEPFFDAVSNQFERRGIVVRCLLTRLRSRGHIPPHIDSGFSLGHSHRFHIPVVTNDDVRFTVGGETIHMRPGEIWEINNKRFHGAINQSTEDRVHLILDWAEPMTDTERRAYLKDRVMHQKKELLGETRRYD
jgi:aspartyl/asparaginyl beta-hydroxylase